MSLKDQLKKKPPENNDYHGKLRSDPNFSVFNKNKPTPLTAPKLSTKSNPALTDGDWTELLSSPTQPTASGGSRGNGVPAARGLSKNNRKQKSLSSGLLVADVKRNPKSGNSGSRSLQRLDSVKEVKLSGKASDDGKESTSSGSSERHSSVESETDGKWMRGHDDTSNKDSAEKVVVETNDKENEQNDHRFNYREPSPPQSLQADNKVDAETVPVSGFDNVCEGKAGVDVAHGQLRSAIEGRHELNTVSGHPISDKLKRGSSMASDGSSDSDTDSGSTSDSESEHEREESRKKRERILAEKAAAKAINTIKELENIVAKLEGEKQSLEKILEERSKQQAQEVML